MRSQVFELTASVAIAATSCAMLAWTWGTWPDVLVDFGQQLYLSWRLAEGEVLYRDLAYYNGPLSLHVNAALFRAFGVALSTLVAANLVILAALLLLLHHLFRRAGGRWSAPAACLAFVLLFAFAQFVGIGNYNYVCPYTHELTHGIALSLAALGCAWRSRGRDAAWLVAGGVALGLAFLTKAEVFLAGAAASAVALGLSTWDARPGWRAGLRAAGAFGAGVLIPPAVAFAALRSAMPAGLALAGTLGSWVPTLNPKLVGLPFFRLGMGTDDVAGNLRVMLGWAAGYAALLAPAALLSFALPGRLRRHPGIVAGVLFVGLAAALWVHRLDVNGLEFARPLPLLMLLAGTVLMARFVRGRGGGVRAKLVAPISLVVFALVLLGKMILNARIYHYGFALAMPATLVLVVALVDWIPGAIDGRGGEGRIFRAVALAALAVVVGRHLEVQAAWIDSKTNRVGRGGDAFWAGERGPYVNRALEELARRAAPGETLAAFPEGITLNYLARRRNPTPYTTFSPTELVLYGEGRILASFREHPPDWVALVHKDTSETGARYFGRDYGRELSGWIGAWYGRVAQVGATPFRDDRLGILLLRRSRGPAG